LVFKNPNSVESNEDFFKLLILSHFFPTPSRFMYSMKCLNPFDYSETYEGKDCFSDTAMKIINLIAKDPVTYPQVGVLKNTFGI
jgi:hypothetical protein